MYFLYLKLFHQKFKMIAFLFCARIALFLELKDTCLEEKQTNMSPSHPQHVLKHLFMFLML